MAYLANKTKFYIVENETPKEIEYLMEVPEFGKTPEKVDVTTLSDPIKKYLPGTKDVGDLIFKFLYSENEEGELNYDVFKELADDDSVGTFQLVYPDGTTHEFDAIPSVKMDAGTVNGALTFSVTMILQSDITVSDSSSTLQ